MPTFIRLMGTKVIWYFTTSNCTKTWPAY